MSSKQNRRNKATRKWASTDLARALEIRRQNRRDYVKRHPDRVKESQKYAQIKLLYGLSREEYLFLLADFNFKCPICESTEKLVVDHCHKTRKIRGILCNKCNSALGYAREDKEILYKLIVYLDIHKR